MAERVGQPRSFRLTIYETEGQEGGLSGGTYGNRPQYSVDEASWRVSVAAELCRRGMVATTFTGNVPDYDIVAVTETGDSVLVQVKSMWGGSWQFANARAFLDIQQDGKRQIPGRRKRPKYPNLIYVFVLLARDGADRFFLLRATELHSMIATGYRSYMKHMGGVRPKNNESYHWGTQTKHSGEVRGQVGSRHFPDVVHRLKDLGRGLSHSP